MKRRRAKTATGPRRPLPAHVRRHTIMVTTMRLALPVLAAVLLASLALWSKLGLDSTHFMLALATVGPQHIDSMSMSNPHYEGIDEKKRPFSITAKSATQLDKAGNLIDLVSPEADITLESGAWLTVNSEKGRYQRAKQFLDLTGVVNMFHDQGFEMHTRDVQVDLTTNQAVGHKPVAGQGPAGDLTGQGIIVSDGGNRVFLLGRSHVVLYASDQLSAAVPLP
jgi:lipopolysaccharide export system protein LptC